MGEDAHTAEQELLKTIEGSGPIKVLKKPAKKMSLSSFDITSMLNPLMAGGLKKILLNDNNTLSLRGINTILIGLCGCVIVWCGVICVQGVALMGDLPTFSVSSDAATRAVDGDMSMMKDYVYYTDAMLGRNMFLAYEEVAVEAPVAVSQAIVMPDITQLVRLVGISWAYDNAKRYVMIEDLNAQVTYYLTEGDTILDFTITGIKEHKVLLSYNDEEVELK